MRSYTLYLTDIADAMAKIEEFVAGMTYEEFRLDDKTQSAVIRKFEVIGEAAKKIPPSIRARYPIVPWRELTGMQDRLVHTHFGVDTMLVWQTVVNRIPELRQEIRRAIEQEHEP